MMTSPVNLQGRRDVEVLIKQLNPIPPRQHQENLPLHRYQQSQSNMKCQRLSNNQLLKRLRIFNQQESWTMISTQEQPKCLCRMPLMYHLLWMSTMSRREVILMKRNPFGSP